jgi:hypothetical protein
LLGAYLASVVAAFVPASITATHSVISSLAKMGVDVDPVTRVSMSLQDLAGLAGTLLPMIAAGFLVAFLVAGMLCLWWPRWRTVLHVAAGAAALIAIHLTLKLALGITPVAIGRTTGGLLVQGLAGAFGGYVFVRLMAPWSRKN